MRKYLFYLFIFALMVNPLYAKNNSSNSKNSFLATSELIITPSQSEEVSPYSEIEVFIPVEIEESSIDKLSLRLKLQKALEKSIPSKWVDGVISYSDGVLDFEPSEPLLYGTYKAVLAKQLKSSGSFILQSPYEWEFSVTPTAEIPMKSITLNSEINSLNIGESTTLLVEATYVDDSTKVVENPIFTISDNSIATISDNGVLTAKSEGTIEVSVTINGFSDSLTIKVKNPLEAISITPESLTLNEGESFELKVIGTYLDGSQRDLTTFSTFSVSNESIISIDSSGNITALSAGIATIEVNYESFSKSVTIEVIEIVEENNSTTITQSGNFANSYSDLIASNATIQDFDEKRFAIVRGVVKGIDERPLSGVKVHIKEHPEYGSVESDSNGEFAIAIEGGGVVTVRYQKDGFASSDRKVYTPWRDIAIVEDVIMLQRDSKVTKVALDGSKQTHTSTLYSDDRGERATTLVFNGVTKATITNEDGSTREISELNVRATEFVVEDSMPSDLPPQSAYTFCSDLTIDEADDTVEITFDKPIVMYVDNFLGFDVGDIVPVGYYDRQDGVWRASDNGLVVKLLDSNGDGVVDSLDSDGDDIADDLNGDGSIFDEVEGLEDSSKYIVGKSYWRAEITHFTPWDFNWPYGPPWDAIPPTTTDVDSDEDDPKVCPISVNSYIDPSTRSFHEDIPIAGTDITLHYSSQRVEGYKHKVTIPTGNPAGSASGIVVNMQIAGKSYQKYLPAYPNQVVEFIWDGRDFRGNLVNGKVSANIQIVYVYPAVYIKSKEESIKAFGKPGGISTAIKARQETAFSKSFQREFFNRYRSDIADGWSLSNHNKKINIWSFEDGVGNLQSSKSLNRVVEVVAGSGSRGFCGDGGLATKACLNYPYDMDIDSKGNLYIADKDNNRIRKVDTNGTITTFAGNGIIGYCGDDVNATKSCLNYPLSITLDSSENLYISDYYNNRIRKVDTNGLISTKININNPFHIESNDGQLYVTDYITEHIYKIDTNNEIVYFSGATLSDPFSTTIDKYGNVYIADYNNHRIRKVDTNGIITTFAGNGVIDYCGDEGLAINACFKQPTSIAVDRVGNFYIADSGNNLIRKINPNGIITTVVGNINRINCKSDGLASEVCLNYPSSITFDGEDNLYIVDSNSHRILKVSNIIDNENEKIINNDLLYQFNSNYNHSKTIDLASKKELVNFEYDVNSSLIGVVDRFNNKVTINRDIDGKVTSITSPDGHITTLNVNSNNDLTSVSYEDGSSYRFSYTSGLMDVMIKPNGKSFYHNFDDIGRVTSTTDPEGGEWSFSRSATEGASVLVLNTAENEKREYQTTKNLDGSVESTIIMPSGESTFRVTNADETKSKSQVCGVDSISEYSYDSETKENYLSKATLRVPTTAEHSFEYNSVGKNTSYTTPLSRVTTYRYDRDRRLIESTLASGDSISYSYSGGKLASILTPDWQIDYSYACMDSIASITKGSESLEYSYDGDLVTSIIQNGSLNQSIGFSYNNDFDITSITYGEATNSFSYDLDGLLISSSGFSINRNVSNGLAESVEDSILRVDRSFNGYGEIDSSSYTLNSNEVFSYSILARDEVGRITSKREVLNGTSIEFQVRV